MLSKRRLRKSLVSGGSLVDKCFCVYVNNDDPKFFASHDEVMSFIQTYRDNNAFFKFQLFRIDTYSL